MERRYTSLPGGREISLMGRDEIMAQAGRIGPAIRNHKNYLQILLDRVFK